MRVEPTIQGLIGLIHDAPQILVLEFAGAGSLALYWLHSVAGSSRTVLEATDRYSPPSMADLLGESPEQFVAEPTARAMAARAYRRAMRLSDGAAPCLGVACTATIATDRAKRGEHRVWVAVQDKSESRAYGVTLTKGARDRLGEETVVSQLIVRALLRACGVPAEAPLELLAGEELEEAGAPATDLLARLLDGTVRMVRVEPDGDMAADMPVEGGLLSGSFNPLHAGHERLAQVASVLLEQPVAFELPVVNADKPPLGYAELERRLDQFQGRYPVVLSRAPLFVEKAALYPGCTFVLGYDTAIRLVAPKYYGGIAERDRALATIREHGCRFLVAGRVKEGIFRTLADIDLPPQFADLFREVPERLFRNDLSSTDIRAQS
jgi:nicotinamide mononucleotide (NMN) deamidase PncC